MKRLIVWVIRLYQKYISPLSPPCCRFSPSCSQYGIEAVERYGAVRGVLMTLWRILRCNPWNPGGYDPVPENNKTRKYRKKYKFIGYKAVKNKGKNNN